MNDSQQVNPMLPNNKVRQVENHTQLVSEKYYVEKIENEIRVHQRHQFRQKTKNGLMVCAAFCFLAVCGYYALFVVPDFVPNSMEVVKRVSETWF